MPRVRRKELAELTDHELGKKLNMHVVMIDAGHTLSHPQDRFALALLLHEASARFHKDNPRNAV